MAKSKYLDSLVELDYHVGVVMDKVRELGIGEDTLVIWTTDNGAWQDVYPDCGYTPFRGTKGTDFEAGSRVPAIAWVARHDRAGPAQLRHRGLPGLHGDVRQPGRGHTAGRRQGRPADDVRQLRPDRGPHGGRALGA